MSEKTTNIADHPYFQYLKDLRPTIRVFDLGEHEYSGAPGLSWRTNYWVKKIRKGEKWELYCSQENSLRKREYAGTYSPDELHEYFDEVGFHLEDWQWREMGLAYTADILVLDKGSVLDFDKLDLY